MPAESDRVTLMNAKNEAPEYVIEEVRSTPWLKSKAGILTTSIVGGVILLGGAFGTGLAVGASAGHPGGFGFDRDGDHRFNGQGQFPDGQHPPRPGDHDGEGGFQMPEPTQTPKVQQN